MPLNASELPSPLETDRDSPSQPLPLAGPVAAPAPASGIMRSVDPAARGPALPVAAASQLMRRIEIPDTAGATGMITEVSGGDDAEGEEHEDAAPAMDKLADEVWRRLRKRIAIEQERERGFS